MIRKSISILFFSGCQVLDSVVEIVLQQNTCSILTAKCSAIFDYDCMQVIVALIAGSILFNLPKFFEYRTVTMNTFRVVGNDLTDFGNSRVFKELYHSWFYIMFVFAVPFASLAVLNSFLVHAVRLARRRTDQVRNMATAIIVYKYYYFISEIVNRYGIAVDASPR